MNNPQAVIAEAKTWCGTPFHYQARLKGVGCDCGQLLLAVYEVAGVIPHTEAPFYPVDFFLHSNDPWFENLVREFCNEISGPPQPADIALFKFGRSFSHGAIVVAWPELIHAFFSISRIAPASADLHPLAPRPRKFFRPKVWC